MSARRVLAVLLLALALTSCSITPDEASDRPTSVATKGRLPDITLESIVGGPEVDLGALRGPAVVNLWASWCIPCKKELPYYAGVAKEYDGRLSVLGVNFQETNATKAQRLLERSGVTYPNVGDPDGEFRAFGLPKLLLVDSSGKVVYDEYIEIESQQQLEDLVAEHLGVT